MTKRATDRVAVIGGLVGLAGLVALAVLAHSAAYFPIDLSVTQALQRLQSPLLDRLALSLDWLGYAPQIMIILGLVCLGLFVAGQRWEAIVMILAGGFEAGVATVVKLLVQRPRPEVSGVHVYQPLGDFTFPSGHTFSYMMVFGLLAYFCYIRMRPSWLRTLAVAALIALVAAVGPVRIYLGEHWLSDVVAGYLLGALGLLLIIRVYRWGEGRFFAKHRH
jgi:membrane-associated phospholipid phosphatase